MKKQGVMKILIGAGLLFTFLFVNNQSKTEVYYLLHEKNNLQDVGKEATEYCQQNDFNEEFCILIDMSIHSGKNRLFLWDMEKDSILIEALCSHGCGKKEWGSDETKTSPVFSNVPDSHCSSIGKYKIGKRGYSQWGINVNYKLHGLEETNDNAYDRVIVFHSWDMISDEETYPTGSPEGWGCPAVANSTLKKLDPYLKKSKKPVLLWMY